MDRKEKQESIELIEELIRECKSQLKLTMHWKAFYKNQGWLDTKDPKRTFADHYRKEFVESIKKCRRKLRLAKQLKETIKDKTFSWNKDGDIDITIPLNEQFPPNIRLHRGGFTTLIKVGEDDIDE